MNNFYIMKSGTLRKKDDSLVLEKDEDSFLIPVEQVDTIFCYGEITLNKRVLEFLNRRSIELMFFNYYGHFVGRFCPDLPGTGEIFFQQHEAYKDSKKRLQIAQAIQKASLHNSLALLKYYHKNGIALENLIRKVSEILTELEQAETVERLMLHEARAKKHYYAGFDVILEQTPFTFDHRSTRPPENEVNSLMSFGYHLLYAEVLKEIDMSRLYSEIAFIHSDIRKGPSLHYDLADIYKPVLIDRLFIRMIRKRQLSPSDFEPRESGIYMKKASQKVYLQELDLEMNKVIQYEERHMSMKSVIRRDIHKLIEFIEGKTDRIGFYQMKW